MAEIYGFIDGVRKSLTQLAAESGISYDTLLARYKAGVPFGELVPEAEPESGGDCPGGSGENGATFTPSVDADGNLSWTNDKGLFNPPPVNIKGPKGDAGGYVSFAVTDDGYLECTYTGVDQPNYSINSEGYLILEI